MDAVMVDGAMARLGLTGAAPVRARALAHLRRLAVRARFGLGPGDAGRAAICVALAAEQLFVAFERGAAPAAAGLAAPLFDATYARVQTLLGIK